ncbi:DUF5670 family protein [Roseisolibacter agri]|uniref:Uncharacterized protein n=1 Tax=Roseisolibacter agri TaxID=2014610 RepID=A0AA37QAG3_9BACT|nr:DUF5670 family protein [Roseisolibacter agri]GLC26071.1 hypothetical protein rosag_25840 [Roseisolibacter agri]
MDLWTIAALLLLAVWAAGTFAFPAPGWVHLLLTAGVFILIWRTVVRATPDPRDPDRR